MAAQKGDFDEPIDQAREQLKTLSALREKLELLTEHVESRKEALEEEIEESLHEAIRNSRDSLEKIQENIEPKLEKVIRTKLEEIDIKMKAWKDEGLLAVRDELKQATPGLTKNVLGELDKIIVEKTKAAQLQLGTSLKEDVRADFDTQLQQLRATFDEQMQRSGKLTIFSLLLSAVTLAALGILLLR